MQLIGSKYVEVIYLTSQKECYRLHIKKNIDHWLTTIQNVVTNIHLYFILNAQIAVLLFELSSKYHITTPK